VTPGPAAELPLERIPSCSPLDQGAGVEQFTNSVSAPRNAREPPAVPACGVAAEPIADRTKGATKGRFGLLAVWPQSDQRAPSGASLDVRICSLTALTCYHHHASMPKRWFISVAG
jgi:hypothetical protein